jgi:hypothetical protein
MEHSQHVEASGESAGVAKETLKKEYTKPELTLHDDLKTVTGIYASAG